MRLQLIYDLLDELTFRRGRWFQFELEFVEALLQRLEIPASSIFRAQLKAVGNIHRGFEYRDVCVYYKKMKGSEGGQVPLFIDRSTQVRLATIRLTHPDGSGEIKASVWLVEGRFFNIAYDKALRKFFATRDLDKAKAVVKEIKVWTDPMETANSDLVKEQFANSSASIEALIGISGVFEQKPPFIGKIVAQKLAEWEVSFPADYIKFISLTDGCMIGQCRVFSITDLRNFSMQNTEFVALAEFENKDILALGYLQTDFGIYYIDVVDDTASPLGVEFLPALKEFIATALAR